MKFGLMFFAASEDSLGPDKYRLVIDSARFADREGFSSVWVPERHFTAFGGLYPNPAVLHAGLATVTSRIRLNAGSVVAPLHHPMRIAEEWSVVDNLSNGRVGVSFASGWNPNDFVFHPERYEQRHAAVFETMKTVQRVWRGEPFAGTSGVGAPASVRLFPKPVQRELPVWLTVAGNPQHFERAGASGANLLTHLLDQDEEVLASRIKLYRDARAAAGLDPSTGLVSLMIHTLVGADADTVREQARGPYCQYIKANIGLFRGLAQSRGRDVDLSSMSPRDLDEFVNFLYERFAASRGLIGTPESCAPLVQRLEQAGVNELACLLDFGPAVDLILSNLPHLARLKDQRASGAHASPAPAAFDAASIRARCTQTISGEAFHQALAHHGIQIGGAFKPPISIWRRSGEALASMVLGTRASGHHVDPAALDACGRILAATQDDLGHGSRTFLPIGFDACDVFAPLTGAVWVHASARDGAASPGVAGVVSVYDESGRELARIDGLRFTAVANRAATSDIGDLLYERHWKPVDAVDAAPNVTGRWLIVPDRQGVRNVLASAIRAAGGECVTTKGDGPLHGIIYLRGLDAVDQDTPAATVDAMLSELRSLVISSPQVPVWIVTCGAQVVSDSDSVSVAQAPLWGFGRALAVERPGSLGSLIDLDPAPNAQRPTADQLLSLFAADRDDMSALRDGRRLVPRLRRASVAATGSIQFAADGVVLITGASGGLGLRLAEWVVSRGARRLIMCSRRAPSDAARAQVAKPGVEIEWLQVDVADARSLNDQVSARAAAITSVFHLAGVLDDGYLGDQTPGQVAGVLAPKVRGAWNLHQLLRGSRLDHFVMFSSVSSLLPAPGQSAYASANAFLDALAHHRRAIGLPALAVNWGPWSDAGHAATDYGRQAHQRLAAMGVGSLSPERGFRVLDALLHDARSQVVAVDADWTRLAEADPAAARLGFLEDMIDTSDRVSSRKPAPLIETLIGLPEDERRPYLLRYLSDMVVTALKLRTDEPLDARQRLFDIGLDSIMALEMKDQLEQVLGVSVSATLLFVRPTLEALCDYVLTDIVPAASVSAKTADLSEEELTRMLVREIDVSRGA